MKSKQLGNGTVLVFDVGDEVVSTLTTFAKDRQISAAHFTAIGAFSDTSIGYFDWEKKDYLKNQVNEQVEVVSLVGDIALDGDNPKVHAHVVVGRKDGTTRGGHLLEAQCTTDVGTRSPGIRGTVEAQVRPGKRPGIDRLGPNMSTDYGRAATAGIAGFHAPRSALGFRKRLHWAA